MPDNFSCVMEDLPEKKEDKVERNMRVAFFCKGKSVAYFDIMQMICHLLAVATDGLKHRENKDRQFLYFLYNPSNLQMSQDAKNEIMHIYDDTCWAANNYDFKALFGHIIDFLIAQKGFRADKDYVDNLKDSFSFMLCDQSTHHTQLN